MGISLRIGRDARQQINQAIRTAGISVVEALLLDSIRHLLPAEKPNTTDNAPITSTHEDAGQ
jgi:hypothetical protein